MSGHHAEPAGAAHEDGEAADVTDATFHAELAALDARVPVGERESLFDQHALPSAEDAVRYMIDRHRFYIPELQYCVNVPGLLQYLREKVGVGHACIACNKRFRTLEAVRHHMVNAGHCHVNYFDHRAEYADFYDFEGADAAPAEAEAAGDNAVAGEPHELHLTAESQRIIQRSIKRSLELGRAAPPPTVKRILGTMLVEYGQRGLPTTALSLEQARQQAEMLKAMRVDRAEHVLHEAQHGSKAHLLFIKKPQNPVRK